MKTVRIFISLGVLLMGTSLLAIAQDSASIQQKLMSEYALTKTTADKTDIVTAGAILVLKKDNLVMVDVSNPNIYQNTYKDGKISQNWIGKMSRFHLPGVPAAPTSGAAQRTWVSGEKMWVTNITVTGAGVTLQLYSDAINDIRYGADLTIPFKGTANLDQQADKLVGEVFKVQPSDDAAGGDKQQQPAAAGGQAQQPAPAGGQQQADAAPAPIPPPPPPADAPPPAPKTIALGQSREMVVANLGQPEKIAKVGSKEIYTYKDLKVTFVNGKVTDVQ